MEDTTSTLKFLESIVPEEGVKFVTEWKPIPKHPNGGVMIHHPANSHADMAASSLEISSRGRNAYFAMATYKGVIWKEKNDYKYPAGRSQDNALCVQTLWQDWDVGKAAEANSYATLADAKKALLQYNKAVGLPAPTVTSSGYGLHAYWTFSEPVSAAEWETIASMQRIIMRQEGIKFDPSRDKDCASVLRPIGTNNYKEGKEPAPVRLIKQGATPIPAQEYKRRFLKYITDNGLAVQPTKSNLAAKPVFAAGDGGNLAGVKDNDYPPSDANRVADKCKQITHFRDTGCAESEPLWYDCLGLIKHCENGEKWAHEWSAKAASYDEAQTQGKIDQWNFPPTTCVQFKSINPAGCEGCTQTCKSPISLGYSEEAAKATDGVLEWFNQRYAVARYLGSVLILETESPGIVGYMKEREFGLLYRNKTITVSSGQNGTKQTSAVTSWLTSPDRRTFEGGARFAPGQNLPPDQFNTWRGWPVTPTAGDWSNFREFMHEVICAGDDLVFAYLLKLLARWVQLPHLPGHVAIFMRGDKGVGKSFFARRIGSLFEPHAIYVGDRNLLTGTFTGHFREVNFAFFDEAVWNGSHEDANRLKALITEKDMMIHPKGLTPTRADNSMHIIVATNDDFAASASHDERRVCMLKPSNARRIDRKYFAGIEAAWNSGEQAAMLYELLHTNLAGFNPEQIPQTDELTNQKILSLQESERVVFETLRDGQFWNADAGHGKVPKQTLATQLAERSSGIERRQADTRMGSAVKRIFETKVLEKREAIGGRQRVWILPPLLEARQIFERYLKVTALNWE